MARFARFANGRPDQGLLRGHRVTRPIKNHASFWPVERFFDAFALDKLSLSLTREEAILYSLGV
ncbi:MAG: hypothetical protein R6X19_04965 [Kiritimatiellia bacterium]